MLRHENLEAKLNLAILFGTGQGVNPTLGVRTDPHWDVVAVPASVTTRSVPYDAFNPRPSGLASTFFARNGYSAGGGVTNYWMAPNTGATSLVTASPTLSANYNWIAAQTFTVPTAGIYAFDFQGTADNAISFYINGSITGTNTQNPTITGGTKIGGTYNDFGRLWTFKGSAYLNAGTNKAYMVLNDYGVLTAALIIQSEFRAVTASATVNDITVNEASPYAVFSIALSSAQNVVLALSDGTATGGTTSPMDGSVDYGNANLQYSLDNGFSWIDYTGAFDAAPTGGAAFLVRTTIVSDTSDEPDETFFLDVTQGGSTIRGTATINDDDPTGDIYIGINNVTVNEASPHAVFAVALPRGLGVNIFISNGTATGGTTSPTDGTIDFTNTPLQISTNNGTSWSDYTPGGVITPTLSGGATRLLVRAAIINDRASDNNQTFTLDVVPSGPLPGSTITPSAVTGTATIKDDGNGTIFNPDGSENTSTTKDDDRSVTVTSPTVNEASPYVFFTVDGEPGQLVSLALTAGTATPGAGNDYTSSMEISTDGGATWTPYTSGTIALAGTGGKALVRVPVLNDDTNEPDETFTLTATNTGGTGFNGVATIVDTGNGTIFNPDGSDNTSTTKDDDRPVTVTSPTVNEASPYVFFTVDGEPGQLVSLALTAGTATPGAGNDYTSAMEVSTDGGATWTPYISGTIALNGTGGTALVRVPVLNDDTNEPDEAFTLTATNTGGKPAVGTATIVDTGNGTIFNPDGSENTSTTKDDDRPVTVTSPTVNEASPYAFFTVDGEPSQLVSFALTAGTATPGAGNDYTSSMEISTNGGVTWVPYTSGTIALNGTGGTALVRVPVLNDTTNEPDETFTLTATNTGGKPAVGTATIVDDGNGTIFNPDGSENNSTVKDDDTALITGTDFGCQSGPIVRVIHPGSGTILSQRAVYEPTFRGGVRVYGADITGDGIPEILTAPGPGRPGEVRVFDRTLNPLPQYNFFPFGSAYRSGVEIAVGSVTGPGRFEIVAAQSGGQSLVRVFTVNPGSRVNPDHLRQFQPFGPRFVGGVTVATADLGSFVGRTGMSATPDGVAEVVVGSGAGPAALVQAYNVRSATPALINSFQALDGSTRGVSVSRLPGVGGAADRILVSGGQRSGGRVETWRRDGSRFVRDAAFSAYGGTTAAVHVAAIDAENIFAAEGVGARSSGIRKHTVPTGGTASTIPQSSALRPPLRVAVLRR